MRLLHTSDWHLGHQLHEVDRGPEHDAFLAWLLEQLEAREVDALLICGDVFETANPPTDALRRWYRFLRQLDTRLPALDVVVVGGNHDSAARLDAPRPLLEGTQLRVIGGLPRRGRDPDLDSLLVPLTGADGEVGAWVAALPYLRPADLPRPEQGDEPEMVAGVRALYTAALQAARARRQPGQALLATGHLYMAGGALSELSERRIQVGNQQAVPADVFPADLAYAALGHLHKGQRVGGREEVRYCGAPLALSMGEAGYRHQVLLVELEGEDLASVEELEVPTHTALLRIPAAAPGSLKEVLAGLSALPPAAEAEGPLPFLEVRVRLDRPEPGLRARLDEAVADRAARMVKISLSYPGSGEALGQGEPRLSLEELSHEEVLRRLWARQHEGEPDPALVAAFHTLLEKVRGQSS